MEDLVLFWDQARGKLKEQLGASAFETWIFPLKARTVGNHSIVLEAPDNFFKEWVQKNYGRAIEEAIKSSCPEIKGVSMETASQQNDTQQTYSVAAAYTQERENQYGVSLNSRYTFDNFVIGPSNRHAHAYSMAVAQAPAKTYNPLFIYGGVGLGKTHLIQAICHRAQEGNAGLKIAYLPSEQFTNELITAIQRHSTAAFRQKYRSTDVLVIDDVHFFGGKDSTQEEFFHTFNALYDAHKQIILSSDRPPKEIADLQERLVSRFGWGLTTDIQPPDLETRVAILKKKIEREPVLVPDDVIFFIAQLIKTNIRELEGALVRTMAYSLMEEGPITMGLAKEVLKDLLKEPKKLITVDFIMRCVAEEFGVSLGDIKTRRRNKTIVLPRQVAMYLSREMTDLSLPEIGQFFGGKDHTTVLHSYNKIKESISKNSELHEKVARIIHVIKQ